MTEGKECAREKPLREGAWDRECKGGSSQGDMGKVTEGENMSMSIYSMCINVIPSNL